MSNMWYQLDYAMNGLVFKKIYGFQVQQKYQVPSPIGNLSHYAGLHQR